MKVIVNFGEKKVVVPCGIDGDLSIRDLIYTATAKYCKLSAYNQTPILSSSQVQLRLNNGAVVDPDDRVGDVVDDREELFAIIDSHPSLAYPSHTNTMNSNGELSSSLTSSNLSSSLSEHDRFPIPPTSSNNRHEVLVTDADLRARSLRVKNDPNYLLQQTTSSSSSHCPMTTNRIRPNYSPPTHDANSKHSSSDDIQGMSRVYFDEQTQEKVFSILLPKENSPLGIHVIPASADEQIVNGLVLQNIEADGRIRRQGILQINDRIIEINRTNIERCSFDKAQLIFRTALLEPELELKVVRSMKKPPIPPKPASFRSNKLNTRSTLAEINSNHGDVSLMDHDSNMNSLNTRRLGKIIKINLVKGNDGLGFKLASRDNPTGAANPIYVKTIFLKGAAIENGHLQRGDRLLSVNSIDVTQMSLQETVALLRDTRIGETVELCISRQREGSMSQDVANEDMQINDNLSNEANAQLMTFDIPLNDTSSAGLGITLKGKTSIIDGQSIDLGIFAKSILTGGAASRDNRLRPNDQILIINDSSLVNLSNLEAAAILHEAVRREIHPGHIKVTVSRLPNTFDEQQSSSARYVKEIDLSPLPTLTTTVNNDENELDLTTFVPPPLMRKPPSQQSHRHSSRLESTRITEKDGRSSSPRSMSSSARSTSNASPARTTKQTFVPNQSEVTPDEVENGGSNPFDRETAFRQSVSEKRRLTHQPNKQAIQWKQRSFHEGRSHAERKQPMRAVPDGSSNTNTNRSSPGLTRASSFESIHLTNEERESPNVLVGNDEERKRQAKLRSRACNDSFRQAVDKSYCQNVNDEEATSGDKSLKSDKQRFRFANLFTSKSKRKDTPDDKSAKSVNNLHPSPAHEVRPVLHPPPAPFNTRQDPPPPPPPSMNKPIPSQNLNNDRSTGVFSYSTSAGGQHQQGYQPYRFEPSPSSSHDQQIIDHFTPTRYESHLTHDFQSKTISGKSSVSSHQPKSLHPPIPRQFFHTNISGSQSLRQHAVSSHPTVVPISSRSPYPSTFTVQPGHFTAYSHNQDYPIHASQQQPPLPRRLGHSAAPVYPTARGYFQLESPANV